MAANAPQLKGIEIYLPGGEVKRFKPHEVAAYGVTPQGTVVAVKHGETWTRYCNFPVIIREEMSAILVPQPGDVPI